MKNSLPLILIPASLAALLTSCNHCDYGYKTDVDCRIQRIVDQFKSDAYTNNYENYHIDDRAIDRAFNPTPNWWDSFTVNPIMDLSKTKHAITLNKLMTSAMANSTQIRVFKDMPLVHETGIQMEEGSFDTIAFIDSKFNRRNDPIGDSLTAGPGIKHFRENNWKTEVGVKKKLKLGTDVTLAQKFGYVDSNSQYMIPNAQGSTELNLTITQPLLKGGGYEYNTTSLRIAEIKSEIAMDEFIKQTEAHLLEVARSYWKLYQARAVYLQKKNLLEQGQKVLEQLEGRANLDANSRQLSRARSSVAHRKAELVRAEMATLNTQDRLKTLVNDPELYLYSDAELVPQDLPIYQPHTVDLKHSAILALQNRSEISQAFHELNTTLLKEKAAKNELMPSLNLYLEGRLRGPSGEKFQTTNAFPNQFSDGGPGGAIGLKFEWPIENNFAKGLDLRRRIEVRQQTQQVLTTIETILLEVKIYSREVWTSNRDLIAKQAALEAAQKDLEILTERRDLMSEECRMDTCAYMEFLLESQDRLAKAEEEYACALGVHNMTYLTLQKAQGTLLCYKNINTCRTCDCNGLPIIELVKK